MGKETRVGKAWWRWIKGSSTLEKDKPFKSIPSNFVKKKELTAKVNGNPLKISHHNKNISSQF